MEAASQRVWMARAHHLLTQVRRSRISNDDWQRQRLEADDPLFHDIWLLFHKFMNYTLSPPLTVVGPSLTGGGWMLVGLHICRSREGFAERRYLTQRWNLSTTASTTSVLHRLARSRGRVYGNPKATE